MTKSRHALESLMLFSQKAKMDCGTVRNPACHVSIKQNACDPQWMDMMVFKQKRNKLTGHMNPDLLVFSKDGPGKKISAEKS